jgi:uncharacterized membrane protein YccC
MVALDTDMGEGDMNALKRIVTFVAGLLVLLLFVSALGSSVGPVELLVMVVVVAGAMYGLSRLIRLGAADR